jgi:signal transduction histidine kinase
VLTVPLHLLAFVVLYVGTARVMETEILSLASEAAEDRLERVVRELNEVALAHAGTVESAHIFGALIGTQSEINLQLFLPGGSFLGPPMELSEKDHERIAEFFRSDEVHQVWLSSERNVERMRGLRRVRAIEQCEPCHQPGETLAVAAMSLNLTTTVARVRTHSRRNLGILIIAWAALLGLINIIVRRSVQRSAARLEAQLAAAEAGASGVSTGGRNLVLDPESAQLHRALREFLERRRLERAEMASRMEHTDQLASLGRLAVGLAHEIKNPLAGIKGALEILREDNVEKRTATLYDAMLEELERVNTTLQLLLESARPSPPQMVETDVRRLIKEAIYLLRPGLKRNGVTLRYEFGRDPKTAALDGAKIRQVLINLIQNAAEAMDTGGNIVVRAAEFPEDHGGLILAVEDDGPGITEENQKKIFDPFFTTKFSGTGLGLAIARRLVEQQGGTLQVDSKPGQGTTFYVLLPSPEAESGLLDRETAPTG